MVDMIKPPNYKHHWKCKDLDLSHLFFADDVLLFSKGDQVSIKHTMDSLERFSSLSGLNPSLTKSNVYFCNCDANLVSWFNSTFGIPHGSIPVKFLGVPLISSQLTVTDCMPLVDKITARIMAWTNLFLSLAGRAQLIRSVLFSMQSFWTNHFMLPVTVHNNLQKLFTRFLWKGSSLSKGGSKVSWATLCLPKEEGGLGLKNMKEWNKAQLLLHLCKIINKHDSLWPRWINATALKHQKFWIMEIPSDCSWIWRRILQLRPLAQQFLAYKIGNGQSISLWFDPWYNSQCLAATTHDSIISQAVSSHSAVIHDIIASGAWILPNPNSRHHHLSSVLTNWLANFNTPSFDLSKPDVIIWDDRPIGKIKIWHIWDSIRFKMPTVSWHKGVWHRLAIPRYAHYLWLVCHGRINTLQRLASFGMEVLDLCYLCVGGRESLDHLFLSCSYIQEILAQLGDMLGLPYQSTSWIQLLQSWLQIQDPVLRHLALLALQVFVYHLWRERNSRAHNNGILIPAKLLTRIIQDIKSRLSTSTWFLKKACGITYSSWINS